MIKLRFAQNAMLLRDFETECLSSIFTATQSVIASAPLRHMTAPSGAMSVAMTNCGAAGWVADASGYKYTDKDPQTGNTWPAMPAVLRGFSIRAAQVAGFENFMPDACLINSYAPGAKLGLHQDKDEQDMTAPIVSISLGLSATFLFGGLKRDDKVQRIPLRHGDVVVWGGPSRLAYHGIAPLKNGEHPVTGNRRINLTLRKSGK
jgi:DNA oxidative demethylase